MAMYIELASKIVRWFIVVATLWLVEVRKIQILDLKTLLLLTVTSFCNPSHLFSTKIHVTETTRLKNNLLAVVFTRYATDVWDLVHEVAIDLGQSVASSVNVVLPPVLQASHAAHVWWSCWPWRAHRLSVVIHSDVIRTDSRTWLLTFITLWQFTCEH